MPPARRFRTNGPFSLFTWSAAAGLAVAIVIGSAFTAWAINSGLIDLRLRPEMVWEDHAWYQLLTYCFFADNPWNVGFACLVIWRRGGSLQSAWGSRRLWLFALGVTVLAGLATSLIARIPAMAGLNGVAFAGAPAMAIAVWVAEGWRLGRRQSQTFGIPMTGNQTALVGMVMVGLFVAFEGVLRTLPDILILGMTYLYVIGWSPSMVILRVSGWRLQRQMQGRARHLRVVDDGTRNTPRDSDRYLH